MAFWLIVLVCLGGQGQCFFFFAYQTSLHLAVMSILMPLFTMYVCLFLRASMQLSGVEERMGRRG